MEDYYSILGIDRSASPEDIKQAYRKLASKYHPDRGGDTKKFQDIQAAYDTLGDPAKKAAYDNPKPAFNESFFDAGGIPPEFQDFFNHFNFNPFGRSQTPRNRTLNIQTSISLEEAYNGRDLVASLTLPNGKERLLEIKIPAGIQDGSVLRLPNMGDDTVANAPRGDIMLTVNVRPHPVFRRQGDDLIQTVNINCIEAMTGKTIYVNSINGKTIEVKIPAGIQNNQVLAIAAHGMPNMADNRFRGRLLLDVNITILQGLDDVILTKLKELFKDYV